MIQVNSRVVSNQQVTRNYWRMVLDAPSIAGQIKPGQFINVRLTGANAPLFRRPFSVLRTVSLEGGLRGIEVVYQVVGRGTRALTSIVPGKELDLLGPLGQGFQIHPGKKIHILLGGGMGAVSLFMLGEEISRQPPGAQVEILLGAGTGESLFLETDFRSLGGRVLVSTEDGSRGYRGQVTGLLNERLHTGLNTADCALYACGPEAMLQTLVPICRRYKIPAQVSLERRMMCGFGACLACVCRIDKNKISHRRDIRTSHIQVVPHKEFGYALTCQDGPVFDLEEVSFE